MGRSRLIHRLRASKSSLRRLRQSSHDESSNADREGDWDNAVSRRPSVRIVLEVVGARVLHLEGFEGKAVAVDQDTDEVVASAETPQELLRIIRERGLRNTMILRAPRLNEPLRVGRG
jgi:hypothetical protein